MEVSQLPLQVHVEFTSSRNISSTPCSSTMLFQSVSLKKKNGKQKINLMGVDTVRTVPPSRIQETQTDVDVALLSLWIWGQKFQPLPV